MSNLIIVGSTDCTIYQILEYLKSTPSFSLFSEKLSYIAVDFRTCRPAYNKIRDDLLKDKRTLIDAVHDIIEQWASSQGSSATLDKLIKILNDNGMTACAEQLQNHFPPQPLNSATSPRRPALATPQNDQVSEQANSELDETSVVDSISRAATPLHLAVQLFEFDEEFLSPLSAKVNFNIEDTNGDTILAYAVKCQRSPDTLFNLIKYGANCTHLNNHGRSLLHISALQGTIDSLQFFLDLRELNPVINEGDGEGNTPLHCGVMRIKKDDAIQICSKLISKGADAHISNNKGQTTLHVAAHCTDVRLDVIKFMIDNGAPLTAKDNVMQKSFLYFLIPNLSPLQLKEITKFLVDKGNYEIFHS